MDLPFSDDLRARLQGNLEAFEIERVDRTGKRHAAVTVTIIEADDGSAAFVLTRRAPKLKAHSGQFALPGGRIDEGETVVEAALRELREEVDVNASHDTVLGRLDDYETRSGFVISPVVVWAGSVELRPNPDEVDRVYRLSLADLDSDDAPLIETIPESDRPVIMMPLMGGVIFAPTAAVLFQFREVAIRGNPTRVGHFDQPRFAWK